MLDTREAKIQTQFITDAPTSFHPYADAMSYEDFATQYI